MSSPNSSSTPSSPKDEKKRVSKEKLRTIMEAASALTALGDEESSDSRASSPANLKAQDTTPVKKSKGKDEKRFLPDHKKPDAALTFPEKVSYNKRGCFPAISPWRVIDPQTRLFPRFV